MSTSIKDFLDRNPSISEILDYVDREAQKIAEERKAAQEKNKE